MSALFDELGSARRSKRTVAVLLCAAGALQLLIEAQSGTLSLRYLPGFLGVAAGVGLWMQTRWARWLALGACFLAIVAACVVPVLIILLQRRSGLEASNIWSIALALLLGAIGYTALGYFRSEAGREDFSGSPDQLDPLPNESSSQVVLSSLVWLAAAAILWFGRTADQRVPAPFRETPRPAAVVPQLPDLVPLGLCLLEIDQLRRVDIAYANIGKGKSISVFRLSTSDSWGGIGRWLDQDLEVPSPGGILTVPYEREADESRKRVLIRLDEEHRVPDADEENNVAQFEIPREPDGKLALPSCGSLRLPAMTREERAARSGKPDLVLLGLCMRGKHELNVHFTNLGGSKGGGLFQISQARLQSKLTIVDPVYNPVPHHREVRSFGLGPVNSILGQKWETTDYCVLIDHGHVIDETNDVQNLLCGRVTRGSNGKIELPDCDALDDNFYSPPKVVEPPPAPAADPALKLPDLVPLGLCYGVGVQLVIGNIGTAKGTGRVSVAGQTQGKVLGDFVGELQFTPWPGAIGKIPTWVTSMAGPTQLDVELDPRNAIAELDETNNSASFGIGRRADGGLNLPDCTLIDARVDKWGKTTSKKRIQ